MISLLTRAMISSTVLPLSGLEVFGVAGGLAGFWGFASGSGAAIPGFSRVGAGAGFGGVACGWSCAASGRLRGKAAQSATITTRFRINFLTSKV
jgi:hypothetical protein